MKINIEKTKVLRISKKGKICLTITINGQELEQVEQFKFLGSIMMEDGSCTKEIRTRIAMPKTASNNKKKSFTSRQDIRLESYIWSIALYAV